MSCGSMENGLDDARRGRAKQPRTKKPCRFDLLDPADFPQQCLERVGPWSEVVARIWFIFGCKQHCALPHRSVMRRGNQKKSAFLFYEL